MDNIINRINELQTEYKSVANNITEVNRRLGELEKRRIELEAVITELYRFVGDSDDTENQT